MKVLQLNTTYNIGSTGRIVAGIDRLLQSNNIESYVGYGYGRLEDDHHYKMINRFDSYLHIAQSRLKDNQGLNTSYKTRQLIKYIESVHPEIVHLHNLHGSFLNYKLLFNYLINCECKVIWTLHDCWPFTGHCAYFDMAGCSRWKEKCHHCPQTRSYPPSLFDNSEYNFVLKRSLFTALGERLILVPVSNWLKGLLKDSFFSTTKIQTIHNGINLSLFHPVKKQESGQYILGVAAVWDKRKGLEDFIKLRETLDKSIDIILVGLTNKQINSLPSGIKGITRTNSTEELCELYSNALVTVNPTYEDNYPTVNLESIACGTPVITYRTGGSPESVDHSCGVVVDKSDIMAINTAIKDIEGTRDRSYNNDTLRQYAMYHFDERKCFAKYIDLYQKFL